MKRWIAVMLAAGASACLACQACQQQKPSTSEPASAPSAAAPAKTATAAAQAKAIDLVCEMEIETAGAISLAHDGKTYHFCSESCRQRFKEDPDKFIKPAR